jgi:outer membrane protein OmpA-like peptidoglycan-associated protein
MNGGSSKTLIACLVVLLLLGGGAALYKYWPVDPNKPPVGPTPLVLPDKPVLVPFIFWGGDVATFHANGNLETQPNSIFEKLGLKMTLTPGDNFDQQVKDYLAGKSPFLRGTMSMLGQVSDQLTANAATTPVVFMQLTWSAGDHMVGRESIPTLNNLKGKKIALQKGGPHVGMLNDILNTTKLGWKDITVVWTDDVSGDKGPAELFRKDKTIDACFAISPDMSDLCGGLDDVGSGQKKTVKGAHVVVSTAHMSRSIADVYACRKDFFEKYRGWIEKFAAGLVKGAEELVAAKKKAGEKWADSPNGKEYVAMIKLAQNIWGQDKSLKDNVAKAEDVDGLISDATFVGLPGNQAFFTKKGNLSGFENKMSMALQLPEDPAKQPLKTKPKPFEFANFNYDVMRTEGKLTGKAITAPRFAAEIKIEPEKTIYSFEILFQPDQSTFDERTYGKDFQRALEQASLFGNAVVAIRGHADIVNVIFGFEKAAQNGRIIKAVAGDDFMVVADGSKLKLTDTAKILKIIEMNPGLTVNLGGQQRTLKNLVDVLRDLSDERSKKVRGAVEKYAKDKGLVLESSQIRTEGVGVSDPAYPNPGDDPKKQAANRRVVFSIIKVPAEKVGSEEFAF